MIANFTERRMTRPLFAIMALAVIPTAHAQDSADAKPQRIDAEVEVTGRLMLAETEARADDDILDGSFVSLRVAPTVKLTRDNAVFSISNATTRVAYFSDDRTDRWQNVARVQADFDLSKATSLQLSGERSDNILTAEAPLTDEWEAGARIEHALDSANRIALGARWRERSYDDIDRSDGRGPRFDAEYRHRFAANHFAYLRGRYESIASDNDRRDVKRWLASAAYQRPLARDLVLRPSLSWYDIEYSGRALSATSFRRDTVISPEVEIAYSPGAWRFAASARYIDRNSNDPQFDRSGYRFVLEISHAF